MKRRVTLPWKRDSRKRVLEKELKGLRRTYEPKLDALHRKGKTNTDSYDSLFGEYVDMRGPVEEELFAIESHEVRRRALKWAVVVPPVRKWERGLGGHRYLDEATLAEIKAGIRDRKRESIKWWVDLFAPIPPLAIGILGALIGVLNAC